MTTNYTTENLQALEQAIALGATEVWYGDKRIVYRSLGEMIRIRDLMKIELGLVTGASKKVIPSYNKGL